MLRLKRRDFIRTLSAGTAGALLPMSALSQSSQNELIIPPLLEGEPRAGARHFSLRAQTGVTQFLSGLNTPTAGFNGDFLGPTLRFREGSDVSISVDNQLGEPTTVHWHGLHVPANLDGGPAQIIESGNTWNAQFQIMQNAGTFWYHSHLMSQTGEQVYRGLSGMIIIDDETSAALDLPSNYGVDDIPLIVQDRRFNEDGSFRYVEMHRDVMTGVFGDRILVNGTSSPVFVPQSTKVRFRILNAANARSFNFAFEDAREFDVVSCDGGFLERAVKLRAIELAPAERAEIVVDFSDGAPVDLLSLPIESSSPYAPVGMMRIMQAMNEEAMTVMSVRPQSRLETSTVPPRVLTNLSSIAPSEAARVRRFVLAMPMGMGMMRRGGGGGGRMVMGGEFTINGQSMDMAVINERVPVGDTEIWEIQNDSMMMHPFHIHHGQFQILDRDGVAPAAHEAGFKDTLRVGPGQTARFIMRFENFSDSEAAYMYHCHILEHEDNGMMGQFTVE